MRWRSVFSLVVSLGVFGLVLLGAPGAFAQDAPALLPTDFIVTTGGSTTTEIRLNVAADKTVARARVDVRLAPSVVERVEIEMFSLTIAGVESSVAVAGFSGTAVGLEPSAVANLTLEVTDVVAADEYEGVLQAKVAGSVPILLAAVKVIKPAAQQVGVREASADGFVRATKLASVTYTVHVENRTDETLNDVVASVDDFDGPLGPVTAQVSFGGTSPPEPRPIPPSQSLDLTFSLVLSSPGDYTSTIGLTVGAVRQGSTPVVLSRTVDNPLTVVGSKDGQVLFESEEKHTVLSLDLLNSLPLSIDRALISVSEFTGPGGIRVAAGTTFKGESDLSIPQQIEASSIAGVVIELNLDASGTYTGTLRVRADDQLLAVVGISVNRADSSLPIEVSAAGPFVHTVAFTDVTVSCVPYSFLVTDTGGVARDLYATVTVKDAKSSDRVTGVELDPGGSCDSAGESTATAGGPVPASKVPVPAVDPGGEALERRPGASGPIGRLVPNEPLLVSGVLREFPAVGSFTATFTVYDLSRTPKAVDASIAVRRPGVLAGGMVLLGASIGLLLSFVPALRRKAGHHKALDWCREQVAAASGLAAPASAVTEHLLGRIDAVVSAVDQRGVAADSMVESVVRQVSLVRSYAECLALVHTAQLPMSAELIAVQDFLTSGDNVSEEAAKASVVKLAEARRIARTQVALGSSVAQLRTAVDAWEAAARPDADVRDPIRAKLVDAEDDVSRGLLPAAQEAWTAALRLLAAQMASGLRSAALALNAPDWLRVDIEPWASASTVASTTAGEIEEAVDRPEVLPTDLFGRYRSAAAGLIRAQGLDLSAEARRRIDDSETPPEQRSDLEKVNRDAKLAIRKAEEGAIRDASSALASALERMGRVGAGPGHEVIEAAAGTAGAVLVDVQPSLAIDRLGLVPSGGSVRASAPGRLRLMSWWIEGAVAMSTLVVATFLGYQALYPGNSAWGSLGDVFAAVLWGLGVSGATYAGVRPLQQQLLGEKAPDG